MLKWVAVADSVIIWKEVWAFIYSESRNSNGKVHKDLNYLHKEMNSFYLIILFPYLKILKYYRTKNVMPLSTHWISLNLIISQPIAFEIIRDGCIFTIHLDTSQIAFVIGDQLLAIPVSYGPKINSNACCGYRLRCYGFETIATNDVGYVKSNFWVKSDWIWFRMLFWK